MLIRQADSHDINGLHVLLRQVLDIHHDIRPDLFKPGATKYSDAQLEIILKDETRPVFVAVNEKDQVLGYCFCVHQQHKNDPILTPIKTLYIDDLCVDQNCRHQNIGKQLYEYVLAYARDNDYYNVTLNVWAGNDSAKAFYEKLGLKPQKYGMEVIL